MSNYCKNCYELTEQLDQFKAEIKSKTEYIQEQRDIINQYTKEIEMYKKCQGKRASKREEELKAENEEFKRQLEVKGNILKLTDKAKNEYSEENKKLKQTLAEIKEIAEKNLNIHTCAFTGCGYDLITNQILQKINEVENAL